MTTQNNELAKALLSQKQLTGTELSLQEGNSYFKGLTEAFLIEAETLDIEMSESQAQGIALHLIAKVDITNPVVGHKGFRWLAKSILPAWAEQRYLIE